MRIRLFTVFRTEFTADRDMMRADDLYSHIRTVVSTSSKTRAPRSLTGPESVLSGMGV